MKNDGEKKPILLRLSKSMSDEIARWAEEDFRSVNGQIEYLLSCAIEKRIKKKMTDDNDE